MFALDSKIFTSIITFLANIFLISMLYFKAIATYVMELFLCLEVRSTLPKKNAFVLSISFGNDYLVIFHGDHIIKIRNIFIHWQEDWHILCITCLEKRSLYNLSTPILKAKKVQCSWRQIDIMLIFFPFRFLNYALAHTTNIFITQRF
jgi:hypothetical protein